jgi:serine/threonine-protein kinase
MSSDQETENRLRKALADRYRIERELGSGGMATVYLAEDLKHHRQVAVKVLDPELAESVGAERFLREIETAANLTHPHILPVFDSGEADGFIFYVMPYVEGESLRSRLTKEKQLPVEDAIQITREIADALDYAHREGVIHRDVKPANIMLEEGHAVLADFGVAHAAAEAKEERITRTGTSLGTPAYMSPEQASGERDLDGRSDQYALGCVLYEMLAGQPPFTGVQVEAVIRQHLAAEPPDVIQLRPTVPTGVTEALSKALAKAPADRFTTTHAFREVLAAELRTPPEGIPSLPRGKKWLVWAVGGAVFVAAAAAMMMLWPPQGGEDPPPAVSGPAPYTILAEVTGSAPEELREAVGSFLAGEIDGAGILSTLSSGQVRLGLESAMMPPTTPLSGSVARELAVLGRIETVVLPELNQIGGAFNLIVRVLRAEEETPLVVESASASRPEETLQAVEEVVDSLVAKLPAQGIQTARASYAPPITSSLEAFLKYRAGRTTRQAGGFQAAVPLLKEALAVDPDFAMVFQELYHSYNSLGFPDSARAALDEVFQRPERLTEYGRMGAEIWRAQSAGDYDEMVRLAENRQARFGRTSVALGLALRYVGRLDESVRVLEDYLDKLPFGPNQLYTANLSSWLASIGRVEAARTWLEKLNPGYLREVRELTVEICAGEWEAAEEAGLRLLRNPETDIEDRGYGFDRLAAARAARGRVGAAFEALQRSVTVYPAAGIKRYERGLALAVASGILPEELDLGPLWQEDTELGQAAAIMWAVQTGDTTLVRRLAPTEAPEEGGEYEAISEEGARDLLVHAFLRKWEGDWAGVIAILRPAIRPGPWRRDAHYRPLMEWSLGEAYERMEMPDSAAAHFAELARFHSYGEGGLGPRGFTHAFAHRRAALLYGQLGQEEEAIEHWQTFLDAFTEPDPEFEWMVEDGRAELERLEG